MPSLLPGLPLLALLLLSLSLTACAAPTAPPVAPTPLPVAPTPPPVAPTSVGSRPQPTPARQTGATVEKRIRNVETGFLSGKATLADRMREYHVPGVSIAVIQDYQIDWAKGYGVQEAGRDDPVTTETLFQAASISKPVAAYAALRLVQAGKIGLDDDVNTRLVAWRVPDNQFTQGNPVTLRRLLSHTAGTSVAGFRGYGAGQPVPTTRQILTGEPPANSGPVTVDTPPGRRYFYSGGGYTIVQQLVSDLAGRPYGDYLRDSLLRPLGMTHSTFEQPLPQALWPQAAVGHTARGAPIPGRWMTHPELGAAGLWTTPSDLARFAIEVQRARQGEPGALLDVDLAQAMLKTQVEDERQGAWGLGVNVGGEGQGRWFSHGGGNYGYRCRLIALPATGQGLLVMTNAESGGELIHEILLSVATEYNWPGFANR